MIQLIVMEATFEQNRFNNLLGEIGRLANDEWEQFLQQVRQMEQQRRSERQLPPEERRFVAQLRRSILSDEDHKLLEKYAYIVRERSLTEEETIDRDRILETMGKLDLLRTEALIKLSRAWNLSTAGVIERVGLPKTKIIYVGK